MPRRIAHPASFLITNLMPLIGVLFLGWSLSEIVVAYWLEGIFITLDPHVRMFVAMKSPSIWRKILGIFLHILTFAPFFFIIHLVLFLLLVIPFVEIQDFPFASMGISFVTLCFTYGFAIIKDRFTISSEKFGGNSIVGFFSGLRRLAVMPSIAIIAWFVLPLLPYIWAKPFVFIAIKSLIDWRVTRQEVKIRTR